MRRISITGVGVVAAALVVGALGLAGQSTSTALGPTGQFPAPAGQRSATLWAVGDGADGSQAALRVARLIRASRPSRLLYLGDVYESGSASDFRDKYATAYGRLKRTTAPTPGNHDWPAHRDGYDRYWRSVTGKRPPDHYSFRLAGWQVLSLNSETSLDEDSAQGRWLRRRLAAPGTCRIAFWHRPRYSAGSHGDQSDVEPLWRLMAGEVPLVLNGHDHNMQQLRPRDGVTELISGAGGHSQYDLDAADPRLAWSNDSEYGALRLRLRPGRAPFAFVAADGRVLRNGSVGCR